MVSFLLRIEGVNFDESIYDTNNLSTIRGASLTLLRLDRAVEAALEPLGLNARNVFSGASQCAYAVEGGQPEDILQAVRDRLRHPGDKGEPFPQIMAVADIVPWAEKEPVAAALDRAEARNRSRQFRQWTVSALPSRDNATDTDPLDGISPASELARLPKGKVLPRNQQEWGKTCDETKLSPSVLRRRKFGIKARQDFYYDEIGETKASTILGELSFSNSLEDMVSSPPPGMSPSLRNKVAVFYADGNGFGAIRAKSDIAEFSATVSGYRRQLLEDILGWLSQGARGKDLWNAFAIREDQYGLGLRFETLLWGGDECTFVMPAWLAFAFARRFCATTRNWTFGTDLLSHAVGIAIAHHKTPIRQLTKIAKAAADEAKAVGLKDRTTVTFDIFESIAPPDTDLAASRARLYRATANDPLAGWLAFPADHFDTLDQNMFHLTGADGDDPFPRSQLYGALRALRDQGQNMASDAAAKTVKGHFDEYARRAGGAQNVQDLQDHLLPGSAGARPLALDVALICQLWDYAHPFGMHLDGLDGGTL